MRAPSSKDVSVTIAVTVVIGLLVCACRSFPLSGHMLSNPGARGSLAQARVRILYKLNRGSFNVTRVRNSIRVLDMTTGIVLGERQYFSTDETCENRMIDHTAMRMVVESRVESGPTWQTQFEIRIHPDSGIPTLDRVLREGYGVKVTCRLVEPAPSASEAGFMLVGTARTNRATLALRAAPRDKPTGARAGLDGCLYDPKKLSLVQFAARKTAVGEPEKALYGFRWPLRMQFESVCEIDFAENISLPATLSK